MLVNGMRYKNFQVFKIKNKFNHFFYVEASQKTVDNLEKEEVTARLVTSTKLLGERSKPVVECLKPERMSTNFISKNAYAMTFSQLPFEIRKHLISFTKGRKVE